MPSGTLGATISDGARNAAPASIAMQETVPQHPSHYNEPAGSASIDSLGHDFIWRAKRGPSIHRTVMNTCDTVLLPFDEVLSLLRL